MKYNVRSLSHQPRTSTIKLGKQANIVFGKYEGAKESEMQIEALYALLGGYNEVARSVDLDTFKLLQEKFEAVVEDMTYQLSKGTK